MKKGMKIFIKIMLFYIVWATVISVIPDIKTDNPALLRFWYELTPLLAVILLSIIAIIFIEKREVNIPLLKTPIRNTAIGVVTSILWLGFPVVIMLNSGLMKIESQNPITSLWLWILAVFLNVIMQEYLVRGLVYQLIKRRYNIFVATLITSVIFTGLHGGVFEAGIISILNIVSMSLFVTALLEYTETILAPIIVHSIWNIIGGILLNGVSLAGTTQTYLIRINYLK